MAGDRGQGAGAGRARVPGWTGRARTAGAAGAAALTLALAGPASADTAALRDCLAEAGQADACMSVPLGACLEAPGADTTPGMIGCIGGATGAWDDLLNEAYRAVMAEAREADASGDVLAEALTREATLRQAQRAWIVFRDADCLAQAAQWGQGSFGRVSAANCAMVLTARRAAELLAMKAP